MEQLLRIYPVYESALQMFVSHPNNFSLVNKFTKPTFLVVVNFLPSNIFDQSFKVFMSGLSFPGRYELKQQQQMN